MTKWKGYQTVILMCTLTLIMFCAFNNAFQLLPSESFSVFSESTLLSADYNLELYNKLFQKDNISDKINNITPKVIFDNNIKKSDQNIKKTDVTVKDVPVKDVPVKDAPVKNDRSTKKKPIKIANVFTPIQINDSNRDLILVSKNNPIAKDYIPSNLVFITSTKNHSLPIAYESASLMKNAFDAAVRLFEAANNDGIKTIVITTGYRSYDFQSVLFQNKINKLRSTYNYAKATSIAGMSVAPPGNSEHQTGLAMDVRRKKDSSQSQSFGLTTEGKWMLNNSWKYGFILRYPKNKTSITGIVYEPWHYRYVGVKHSSVIYSKKLCLEEYLKQMN